MQRIFKGLEIMSYIRQYHTAAATQLNIPNGLLLCYHTVAVTLLKKSNGGESMVAPSGRQNHPCKSVASVSSVCYIYL